MTGIYTYNYTMLGLCGVLRAACHISVLYRAWIDDVSSCYRTVIGSLHAKIRVLQSGYYSYNDSYTWGDDR